MSVRDKIAKSATPTFLPVYHPDFGHACIRSLSEYEKSCYENTLAASQDKKAKDKNTWYLSARAKLLMYTLCEPEFLYDTDSNQKKPNPDAFKSCYTTVINRETGMVNFDRDQLKELLAANGSGTGSFAEHAMKHVGLTSQDFEELLKNSEATETNDSQ